MWGLVSSHCLAMSLLPSGTSQQPVVMDETSCSTGNNPQNKEDKAEESRITSPLTYQEGEN